MSFSVWFSYTAKALFLPPGLNITLFLLAFVCYRRFRKTAMVLGLLSSISLYLFSMPLGSEWLMKKVQPFNALSSMQVKAIAEAESIEGKAIVVLGGGRLSSAPEFNYIDTVNGLSLERLRYAAWLHRKTSLPILVTGGSVMNEPTPESVLMNEALVKEFRVFPRWLETESENTAENAQFSAEILKQNGITEIYLITHAWHMQRAKIEFEKYDLQVTPAPTAFYQPSQTRSSHLKYLPSAKALYNSMLALHEIAGRLWYDWFY